MASLIFPIRIQEAPTEPEKPGFIICYKQVAPTEPVLIF